MKFLPFILPLLITLCFGQVQGGPNARPMPERPILPCLWTETPPIIDGKLGDGAWREAPSMGPFIALDGRALATEPTTGYVCYDAEMLYIAADCQESKKDTVWARATCRDGEDIGNDDAVEVFLIRNAEKSEQLHLIVNALGTKYDEQEESRPEDWNGHWETGISTNGGAWQVEIAIPFADLGGAPKTGDQWRFNLNRVRQPDMERSGWACTYGNFHNAELFGALLFEKKAPWAQILDLGDRYGDLWGSAAVSAVIHRGGSKRPFSVHTQLFGGRSHTRSFPSGKRDENLTLAYSVAAPAGNMVSVTVSDTQSNKVYYRSPAYPLQNTFLKPSLAVLDDNLDDVASYLSNLDTHLSEVPALIRQSYAQQQKSENTRRLIERAVPPSMARWAALNDSVRAIQDSLAKMEERLFVLVGYSPDELEADRMQRQYVLFAKLPLETPTYATKPRPQEITDRLRIFAALGEYEPATFMVAAAQALYNISVTADDLAMGNTRIAKEHIQIHVVRCWDQAGGGPVKSVRKVFIPELLLKDDRAPMHGYAPDVRLTGDVITDIPAGTSKQFWLTLWIPEDATPGTYTSAIHFSADNQPQTDLALEVEVLPIHLMKPGKRTIIYYRGKLSPGHGPESLTEARYEAQLRDIAAHGFETATIYDPPPYVKAALDLQRKVGLAGPVPYLGWLGGGASTEGVKMLNRLVREGGYPELIYYGVDEPNNPEKSARCRALFGMIQEAGGRTTTAIPKAYADSLGDLIDLPNYSMEPGFVQYVSDLGDGSRQKSAKTETYYWQIMQEDPFLERLLCGFYLWKSGMDGIFPYVYQQISDLGDPYDDWSGKHHRHHLVTYPSRNGPIPTIQWEAAREGIDDVRYLTTLTELIHRAKEQQRRNLALEQASRNAERVMALMMEALDPDYHQTLRTLPFDTPYQWRWELAQHIMRMQELMKKK
ncbi:MAG: sugar-binding protein [Candidatus Latescibacterota bacterium]